MDNKEQAPEVRTFMAIRQRSTGKYYQPANWFPPIFSTLEKSGLFSEQKGVTAVINMMDKISQQTNDPENRHNLPQYSHENMEVVTFQLQEVGVVPAVKPKKK